MERTEPMEPMEPNPKKPNLPLTSQPPPKGENRAEPNLWNLTSTHNQKEGEPNRTYRTERTEPNPRT